MIFSSIAFYFIFKGSSFRQNLIYEAERQLRHFVEQNGYVYINNVVISQLP